MSAYIVNNETISAIVRAYEIYNVKFEAENYEEPIQIIVDKRELQNAIGQALLDQNYKSINYRYREDTPTPKYNYKYVDVNEGIIIGCINCYIYQACETENFFESVLYSSLQSLKNAMLERMIEAKGYKIPWGYEA